jgi:hypothetical protein
VTLAQRCDELTEFGDPVGQRAGRQGEGEVGSVTAV